MRRGRPVAHSIYGEASVINCANYVYFQAMNHCKKLNNADALHIFIDEMLNLHKGQGLDIYWRDHYKCPTLHQYKDMVLNKTGGLFRLALHLMKIVCNNKPTFTSKYTDLVNKMALFFQIRDDYINLQVDDYMKLKNFCEDITEGKFSFPIIHCILKYTNDHRLLSILKQRTTNNEIKKHAISFMKEAGSFIFTLNYLNELHGEILNDIDELGGNQLLKNIQIGLYQVINEQLNQK